MPVNLVLAIPGEVVYCPYHRAWEVYVGEDSALCDWCCQLFPCSMHGDGTLPGDDKDVYEGFDEFAGEQDSARERYFAEREKKEEVMYLDINDL